MIARRSAGSGTSHTATGNAWNASAITWASALPSTGSAGRIGGSIIKPLPGPFVLIRWVAVRWVAVRPIPVRRVAVERLPLGRRDGPLAQADGLVVARPG